MIIAVSTTGPDPADGLDPRFGRAEHFVLYDTLTKNYAHIDNTDIRSMAHGAGPKTAQKLSDVGVQALITGNGPGGNAARVLHTAGIEVYLCRDDVTAEEALKRYHAGDLPRA